MGWFLFDCAPFFPSVSAYELPSLRWHKPVQPATVTTMAERIPDDSSGAAAAATTATAAVATAAATAAAAGGAGATATDAATTAAAAPAAEPASTTAAAEDSGTPFVIEWTDRGMAEWPEEELTAALAARRGVPLVELHLYGNALTAIPPVVLEGGALRWLTALSLDHNALTVLPDAIGELTALRELALHDNALTALPATIGRLTALESLRLDRNALATLPDEVGDCTALTTLHLDGNPLTALPASLGRLTALVDLGLGSLPRLTALPPQLADATSLALVWAFEDTAAAVTNVPADLLLGGDADALRRHLRTLLPV